MNMTTLNWYLISLNWLKLSKKQMMIVKNIQKQIGEICMDKVFRSLRWKSIAGEEFLLSDFSMEEYNSIPLQAIEKFRFEFAAGIFRELFKTEFARSNCQECCKMLADWCDNKFAEKSKLLDAALCSSNQYFKARDYILGL